MELYIARNLGVFFCTSGVMLLRRVSVLVVNCRDIPLVSFSAVLYSLGAYFFYAAVNYLPLVIADMLSLTTCLVVGCILYRIWLDEKITCVKFLSILIASTGIVAIVQPWTGIGASTPSKGQSEQDIQLEANYSLSETKDKRSGWVPTLFEQLVFGYTFVEISGMMLSTRYLTFKLLVRSETSTFVPVFWGSLAAMITCSLGIGFFRTPIFPSGTKEILLVVGHAFSTGLRIVCLILQVSRLDATVANVLLVSFNALFVLFFQYTFLQSVLPAHHNILEVFGVVLVVYGAAQASLIDICKREPKTETAKTTDTRKGNSSQNR